MEELQEKRTDIQKDATTKNDSDAEAHRKADEHDNNIAQIKTLFSKVSGDGPNPFITDGAGNLIGTDNPDSKEEDSSPLEKDTFETQTCPKPLKEGKPMISLTQPPWIFQRLLLTLSLSNNQTV